ncbi:hypothetical protein BCR22_10110 [Enterococcus plantarum]|uniref:ABC transporter permease n=1 Tax=Enterococcus plantarum TaxID=1077675 RepID=UPI00084DFDD1|nr:ABC transporter permease [Enterococcus plantarum]OEG19072.1 hypothetical protein BCR22_10110 [Enterococcus plantarum]
MIKFEIIKIVREKSLYLLFLLLLIILIAPIFFMNGDQSFKNSQYEQRLQNNKVFLEQTKNDPTARKVIAEAKQENSYFEEALGALKNNDNEKLLQVEYKLEVALLNSMKEGSVVAAPQIEQEKKVSELDYLISHKIEQVDYSLNKIPAINYLYYVFSDLLPYMYFLFVSFIIIANFSTFEKRRKTIDFFNVSPLATSKKLLVKIVGTIFSALLLIYISLAISFVVSALKNGIGNFNYPVSKITETGNVEIISITTFIFQCVFLFSILVIFFSLVSYFVSLFTGNLIINIFLLISFVFISNFNITSSKYSLTNLMNFPNIVIGGTAYSPLPSTEITFGFSVMSIVCYIAVVSVLIGITLKLRKETV